MLEQVCRADPRDAEAWYLCGAVSHESGALAEAETCYRRAVALQPERPETHYFLGNVYLTQGKLPEAADCYRNAIKAQPHHIEAHCNLGAVMEQLGEYRSAAQSYGEALRLAPGRAELHYNMGAVLRHLGQLDKAGRHCRRAIELNPNLAEAYNNLANVLDKATCRDEIAALYRQAIKLKPDYAEAHYNLGITLREQGRLHEAINCYRRTIVLAPEHADVHVNLAFAYLLLGDFKNGWEEYQWHWHRPGISPRPFPPCPWDGTDLKGRDVFLHAEQGLGDELFFLRFADWLKRRGAGRVVYRPSPKIASLLSRVARIDRLAAVEETPLRAELVFSVGDLPRLLGMTQTEEIPSPLPLAPLPERLEAMRARLTALGPAPYVGVTWRAGTREKQGALYKECPTEKLAKLLQEIPATTLILQRHPAPGEVDAFAEVLGRPAHDLSHLNDDLEQMLALLALVDDYVGVSNTNMHLRAGAEKTAKVLVPVPPEWRWMAEGRESPWFPGFGVYRQRYDGSWDEAFDMLATDLKQTHGI